ncbi:MAG: DNA repair protein RecO [Chloroflexi bacterium]|nr:MAG: DNA repair protein RecO [Chloroflexota bacterium]
MPTYQADAIVLRRLDYGETDRIVTLLTREYGKLGAIAKGARKGKSKVGAALDLFARSTMMLAKGKNLDVVAQVERRGDARYISGDLRRTAYACLVAEIVDKVMEDRHPVDEIFELVVLTLQRLNDVKRVPRADAAWFVMRMLDVLGYAPQLQDCPDCGTPLSKAAGWFSPLLGGVLCPRCGAHDQGGSPLSVNGLKVLRLMAAGQAELYDRLRLSDQLLDEVEHALDGQLEYHLDRHLKSLDFIRSIRDGHRTPA